MNRLNNAGAGFRARVIVCAFAVTSLWAADPDGRAVYEARCASCHDSPGTQARIPARGELAVRSPESIVSAMFEGAMLTQASGLSMDEGRALARFITGKEFSAAADPAAGKCAAPAGRLSPAAGDWNGWGVETDNSRYQETPRLSVADIPRLKLKWAFGFPGDSRAFAQPVVVGGRVFVGSAGGMVYSLDASRGCVYWSFKADSGVRTAIGIAQSRAGGRNVAYFGDLQANAYAVDAETGAPIWKLKMDEHPSARITGSPVFYDGRLFVPVASLEEGSGRSPDYGCCTFRGSLVALDAETGRQLWKSYSILDPPKAFKKNKNGVQMYGPAGAAIWSAPTIDAKRRLIYSATGDSYTDVDINTSDAILAFSLDDGRLEWVKQLTEKDNFIVGCPAAPNCPEQLGPDFDFGSSPILRSVEGGKQILIAGQKSGVVWGLDPDQKGKIVWRSALGAGSAARRRRMGTRCRSRERICRNFRRQVEEGRRSSRHFRSETCNRENRVEHTRSQGGLPDPGQLPDSAIGRSISDPGRGFLGRRERSLPRLFDQNGRHYMGVRHGSALRDGEQGSSQRRLDKRCRTRRRKRYGVYEFRVRWRWRGRLGSGERPAGVFSRREVKWPVLRIMELSVRRSRPRDGGRRSSAGAG